MKKLELKVTLEVTDSADVESFVSDIEDGCLCDCCKKTTIEADGKKYEFENPDFEEQKLLVRNKWNKKTYEVLEIKDRTVTLKRPDGTVFTIAEKEYLTNYVKNNA